MKCKWWQRHDWAMPPVTYYGCGSSPHRVCLRCEKIQVLTNRFNKGKSWSQWVDIERVRLVEQRELKARDLVAAQCEKAREVKP